MTLPTIDTHTHVFLRGLQLAASPRYVPGYDAPPERLLATLSAHGVGKAVLVQPSFLGYDNAYLLACLKREPARFRGIAVLDPSSGDERIAAFSQAGVVGIRFNLIGRDLTQALGAEQIALARRVARHGWQVEVQAEGPDLPIVLDRLLPTGAALVIDHFGRPDPALGVACRGFSALLDMAGAPVWTKLSAPYRCGGADTAAYAERLLERLGPGRLLWGSDWPWTQHESGRSYQAELDRFRNLVGAERTMAAINAASETLFGFRPRVAGR
jgi:predicted TIM-barrel fold metal-dependent hydrolase